MRLDLWIIIWFIKHFDSQDCRKNEQFCHDEAFVAISMSLSLFPNLQIDFAQ